MEAFGQTWPKKRNSNRKRQQNQNANIVFSKNGSIQTMLSINKRLKSVTDSVIGLQYVWEYRSPTKSVPPHYQCKLCKVQQLQNEMVAHITGWKHCFKYMKRAHPEKVPHEDEEVTKDATIRKTIRMTAAEVEKAEGRGQVKIVFKEPGDVPAFQNMKSAHPNVKGPGNSGLLGPVPRGHHPDGLFSGGFPELGFLGKFSSQDGLVSDFSSSMHSDVPRRSPLSSPNHYGSCARDITTLTRRPDRMMGGPESMQSFPNRRPMHMDSEGFGMDSRSEVMSKSYADDLLMNSSSDRMMASNDPDGSSTLGTLLRYLDKFRIECEDDAQVVLKITQKLTDVLMEYRLRSISSTGVRSLNSNPSSSLSSMNFSSSRLPPSSSDRFSNLSGSSRYFN